MGRVIVRSWKRPELPKVDPSKHAFHGWLNVRSAIVMTQLRVRELEWLQRTMPCLMFEWGNPDESKHRSIQAEHQQSFLVPSHVMRSSWSQPNGTRCLLLQGQSSSFCARAIHRPRPNLLQDRTAYRLTSLMQLLVSEPTGADNCPCF